MGDSTIPLSYNEYCPENLTIIFLHGLTNTKENWQGCVQTIAQKTGCKAYTLDARNHGDSGWSEIVGYEVMADDLLSFMDSRGIAKAIIVGHSMGGKTGLSFALKYPKRLHSLIVEDISLHTPAASRGMLFKYFQILRETIQKIPPGIEVPEAKKFLASQLQEKSTKVSDGSDLPIRRKNDGTFEWKTNLDVLEDSIKNGKWSPIDNHGTYDGPVLLIYGTVSPYRVLDDKEMLLKQFPNTTYQPIEGGGHSLHQDFPEMFSQVVCDFISKHREVKESDNLQS